MELVARAEQSLVGRARRRVADHATRCGASAEQSLVVELLASEVVTNAVIHGAPDGWVRVRAHYAAGTLTVRVSDQGRHRPEVRDPRPTDPSGRGLRVVEDLAASWGVTPEPDGKSVWFTVDLDAGHEPGADGSAAVPRDDRHGTGNRTLRRVPRQPSRLLDHVPRQRCP
jgi:serine/threonine-protein kinase RsbW